jgi:hypothetical protein
VINMEKEADQPAEMRHTVASDDQLVEKIRAGRIRPDDPDPVAALLARWRMCCWPDP